MSLKKFQLFPSFHTLRNDPQLKAAGHNQAFECRNQDLLFGVVHSN